MKDPTPKEWVFFAGSCLQPLRGCRYGNRDYRYTLGYEGCDLDEFIAGLKKNKIRRIVDIRRTPVSRKKGFSKNILGAQSTKHDIECFYMGKELGVPAEWRKAVRLYYASKTMLWIVTGIFLRKK